jgi:Mg-chelatase subunit ChlD
MSTNLQSLFHDSQQDGMSQASVDLLIQNLDGQTALGCVGAQVDDLNTDDVTLLVTIIDQSSSMSPVRDEVIDAFNQMTRALSDSKARDSILMSCWTFSDRPTLVFDYTPIAAVKDLTCQTYEPDGATALHDAILNGFTGLVAYGQELRNNGIRTRCLVVVISDGGDNVSSKTEAAVRTVADDLIKQELYTLAFVGLGDASFFNQIAARLGFPNVLTVGSSASDIRRALRMVSGSVIRASQAVVPTVGSSFFQP